MDTSEISFRDSIKIGFGFGLGFAAATMLISLLGFLLYMPIMFGMM